VIDLAKRVLRCSTGEAVRFYRGKWNIQSDVILRRAGPSVLDVHAEITRNLFPTPIPSGLLSEFSYVYGDLDWLILEWRRRRFSNRQMINEVKAWAGWAWPLIEDRCRAERLPKPKRFLSR